jgi:hypothetical protein
VLVGPTTTGGGGDNTQMLGRRRLASRIHHLHTHPPPKEKHNLSLAHSSRLHTKPNTPLTLLVTVILARNVSSLLLLSTFFLEILTIFFRPIARVNMAGDKCGMQGPETEDYE